MNNGGLLLTGLAKLRSKRSSPRDRVHKIELLVSGSSSNILVTSKGSQAWVHEIESTRSGPRAWPTDCGPKHARKSKGFQPRGPRDRVHKIGPTTAGPRAWPNDYVQGLLAHTLQDRVHEFGSKGSGPPPWPTDFGLKCQHTRMASSAWVHVIGSTRSGP